MPAVISAFANAAARLFTRRYRIALISVAVISAIGQVVVQGALSRQQHDAEVINRAGRQRNFSQALVKGIIALPRIPEAEGEVLRQQTEQILVEWERVHRGLLLGDPDLGLPQASPQVASRLASLEPAFLRLAGLVRSHLAAHRVTDGEILDLLQVQGSFLGGMEAVVSQLDREARDRVLATRVLELSLFILLGAVLVIEARFIFSPAVHRIRHEIIERERAERIAIDREVAEAGGRMERRIGQDLHDGLGQVLTGISFQAKALQRRLGTGDGAADAAEIAGLVGQAIATTRSLARLLNPVETDAHGLGAALHDLCATTEKVFRVACSCEWDSDLAIPALPGDGHETPAAMHLYRIVQEAISNAIRHGGAHTLAIRGQRVRDEAVLTIDDDGDGFDPDLLADANHRRPGMGLRTMAFRAERIGARWRIQRRTDAGADGEVSGMRVEVRWPWIDPSPLPLDRPSEEAV